MVVGGGAAFAAYRYEQSRAAYMLPGVTIAGVDVGGMSRAEAIAAVEAVAEQELYREIEISAHDRTWHVKPAELGVTADVEAKVDAAMSMGEDMAWTSRAFHRLLDRPVLESFELTYERTGEGLRRFVRVVDKAVAVSPSNARIELVDGQLMVEKPKFGLSLNRSGAAKSLRRALRSSAPQVSLPVKKVDPKITKEELGKTIVVRVSENKLYVYDGLKVIRSYEVATGLGGYPTPRGAWNIWDKRENPTWVNPAPDGWGKDLPAVIGPGPGNPLGTHALYLDAPGIRIHGTYDEGSIGTFASHGCIRMRIAEAKELFGMIDIGTQVLVLD